MNFRCCRIIMIEPITYLYYKCYKLFSYSDKESPDPEHVVYFGIIVFIIILGIAAFISGAFPSDAVLGISFFFTMMLVAIVPFFKHRIVKKYDNISKREKIIGNIVFIVEIIITIFSLIILVTR